MAAQVLFLPNRLPTSLSIMKNTAHRILFVIACSGSVGTSPMKWCPRWTGKADQEWAIDRCGHIHELTCVRIGQSDEAGSHYIFGEVDYLCRWAWKWTGLARYRSLSAILYGCCHENGHEDNGEKSEIKSNQSCSEEVPRYTVKEYRSASILQSERSFFFLSAITSPFFNLGHWISEHASDDMKKLPI